MPTQNVIMTLLIIAIIVYAVIRQITPHRVQRLQFVIFPLLAAYEAYRTLPRPVIPENQLAECLLTILVAFIAGSVQAVSARVFYRGDDLYIQGGIRSLAAWIGLLVSRLVITMVFQGPHFYNSFGDVQWMLWTAVAFAFGTRSVVLYMRHPDIGKALARESVDRRSRRR